jgi:hypothetical protein
MITIKLGDYQINQIHFTAHMDQAGNEPWF